MDEYKLIGKIMQDTMTENILFRLFMAERNLSGEYSEWCNEKMAAINSNPGGTS
jgi:hypothetical protein